MRNPLNLPSFIIIILFCSALFASPLFAADEEQKDDTSSTGVVEKGDPDLYNIQDIVGLEGDETVVGIVDSIEITGSTRVKNPVIIRQLTFKTGEEITQADLRLSEKRLLTLNGLFWYAKFDVRPAEEEGHVILTLTVKTRRSWAVYPAQSGATVSDRNFLGSGKGVATGFYSLDDTQYIYFSYTDPQIFGGHNSMTFEGHFIKGDTITRTDQDFSSGEEYLFEKRGGYVRYGTKWGESVYIGASLKVENVSTEVKYDPFPAHFKDDTFFLSGAWIPDGSLVTASFSLGKGKYNSAFFPTDGYTLWLNTDQSYKFIGSDFNFSRYKLYGTRYFGLFGSDKQALALKGEYEFAGGNPPHYELPVVDYQIRGMGGASDRGKSYIALSGEYRFYMWPNILQGVIFVDSGRAWDDVNFNFDGYETTYGVGVRYQTFEHWGVNILLRADYSLGPYDQRWYFGMGHAF